MSAISCAFSADEKDDERARRISAEGPFSRLPSDYELKGGEIERGAREAEDPSAIPLGAENDQRIKAFQSALTDQDLVQVQKLLGEGLNPNVALESKRVDFKTAMGYAMDLFAPNACLAEMLLKYGATIPDRYKDDFFSNVASVMDYYKNENPLHSASSMKLSKFLELIRVCVQYDDRFSVKDFNRLHEVLGKLEDEGEEAQAALMATVKYASSPVRRAQARMVKEEIAKSLLRRMQR